MFKELINKTKPDVTVDRYLEFVMPRVFSGLMWGSDRSVRTTKNKSLQGVTDLAGRPRRSCRNLLENPYQKVGPTAKILHCCVCLPVVHLWIVDIGIKMTVKFMPVFRETRRFWSLIPRIFCGDKLLRSPVKKFRSW